MASQRPRPSGYKHVVIDPSGTARIAGTSMKVRELVLGHLEYGWSAEELRWQHPYLNLAQIHAALAYYHDHQAQVEQEIEADLRYVDELRAKQGDSPLRQKLARRKRA